MYMGMLLLRLLTTDLTPQALVPCRYGYYDFIVASILFRATAYAARAAYLQQYSPALQGVFLAFGNGGGCLGAAGVWSPVLLPC